LTDRPLPAIGRKLIRADAAGAVTVLGAAVVIMNRMHLTCGRPLIPEIKQQGKKNPGTTPGFCEFNLLV